MLFLTQEARLVCKHEMGKVQIAARQGLVTIARRAVLVANDPEGRPIVGCPNIGAAIKPCTNTLAVEAGYSQFIRIDGRAVCLDTVTGLTDGTPPGVVKYEVRQAGQAFVSEVE
jgi:hypothetical protein